MNRKLINTLGKFLEDFQGGRTMAIGTVLHALMLVGPVTWDEMLLALSNLCVEKFQDPKTRGKRHWMARAKVLHAAMEKERSRRTRKQQPFGARF